MISNSLKNALIAPLTLICVTLFIHLTVSGEEIIWTSHPKYSFIARMINDKNPQASYVAVEEKPSLKQTSFMLGDEIPDAGVLETIYLDRVVLNNKGKKQYILMGRWETSAAPTSAPTQAAAPAPAPKSAEVASPAQDQKPTEPKTEIDNAKLITALATAGNAVDGQKTQPLAAGGALIGTRIQDVQDGSIFQVLGIEKGDIIKSINGRPIDSGEIIPGLLEQIRNDPNFYIEINHNNRPKTLRFDPR